MNAPAETIVETDMSAFQSEKIGISLEGVGMEFSKPNGAYVRAIERVDETVGEGRFVSIVGPSGCGKSTLLSLIAGLQTPSEGSVFVEGQLVTGPRRSIGFVFQEDTTLPWKTVEENVEFGLKIAGEPRKSRTQRTDDMINLVGLQGF